MSKTAKTFGDVLGSVLALKQRFVIFDVGDLTYHLGEGEWGCSAEAAWEYPTLHDAEQGLDDVDCDKILRDRLMIRSRTITEAGR